MRGADKPRGHLRRRDVQLRALLDLCVLARDNLEELRDGLPRKPQRLVPAQAQKQRLEALHVQVAKRRSLRVRRHQRPHQPQHKARPASVTAAADSRGNGGTGGCHGPARVRHSLGIRGVRGRQRPRPVDNARRRQRVPPKEVLVRQRLRGSHGGVHLVRLAIVAATAIIIGDARRRREPERGNVLRHPCIEHLRGPPPHGRVLPAKHSAVAATCLNSSNTDNQQQHE
jgi:hypothetical protein